MEFIEKTFDKPSVVFLWHQSKIILVQTQKKLNKS